MHVEFRCIKLRERDNFVDIKIEVRIILKDRYNKWNGGAWTELLWLRGQTSDELQ